MDDAGNGFQITNRFQGNPVEDIDSRLNAPNSHWSDVGFGEHFVQFYEDDNYIVDSVVEYLIHCLRSEGICIAVATNNHLLEIKKQIVRFGVDLESAIKLGRFITLDAEETLEKIMVNGTADPKLFLKFVGSIVRESTEKGREVRIFGELVNVLCTRENYDAAASIENMWHDLGKKYRFSLFCAYAMAGFKDNSPVSRMSSICREHSRIIPSESYTSLTTTRERLRKIATLQQRVKQLESELDEFSKGSSKKIASVA